MSAKAVKLDQIERWMQSVIMHPGDVDEGLMSDAAQANLSVTPDELNQVIVPSRALTSAKRLEIYVTAYRLRLTECLRAEFPATQYALGDELFDAILFGYLQHDPSRSYTLCQLGAHLPDFLAAFPAHRHAPPANADASWPEFVVELARWERIVSEVFDGPGSEQCEGLDDLDFAQLAQIETAGVRLIPAPDLRVVSLTHPVHRFWRQVRGGQSPAPPAESQSWLAVHRRNFHVVEHELTRGQYQLLTQLTAGQSVFDALARFANELPTAPGASEKQIYAWFSEWAREGFFHKVAAATPGE